nr:2-hydroxy-6-oxononadienedioate/2-hydroxy-6-oxononatrienedioate hydrolase-like [Ipomoea batatas]
METIRLWFRHLLSFYLSVTAFLLRRLLPTLHRFPVFVPAVDSLLSHYFRSCNLSPCTVDLDDHTTMHFWAPTHRHFRKPNLVIIHGYGGNAKWQFALQLGSLAQSFNLYVPDLLFFGDSRTRRPDRTDAFQAKCVMEGLVGMGVTRTAVYGISYGGFVGYRMAEMYPDVVDRVVIVSSGIASSAEQRVEHMERLKKMGCNAADLLLPAKPEDLRRLVNLSSHKHDPFKWVPDAFLQEFITVMYSHNRKEKQELLEYLLGNKEHDAIGSGLTQEALLLWGDKDRVFPLTFGQQLQRYLGPKARLEVLKDAGHAANIDCPQSLNSFIKAFVLHSEGSE